MRVRPFGTVEAIRVRPFGTVEAMRVRPFGTVEAMRVRFFGSPRGRHDGIQGLYCWILRWWLVWPEGCGAKSFFR